MAKSKVKKGLRSLIEKANSKLGNAVSSGIIGGMGVGLGGGSKADVETGAALGLAAGAVVGIIAKLTKERKTSRENDEDEKEYLADEIDNADDDNEKKSSYFRTAFKAMAISAIGTMLAGGSKADTELMAGLGAVAGVGSKLFGSLLKGKVDEKKTGPGEPEEVPPESDIDPKSPLDSSTFSDYSKTLFKKLDDIIGVSPLAHVVGFPLMFCQYSCSCSSNFQLPTIDHI